MPKIILYCCVLNYRKDVYNNKTTLFIHTTENVIDLNYLN